MISLRVLPEVAEGEGAELLADYLELVQRRKLPKFYRINPGGLRKYTIYKET